MQLMISNLREKSTPISRVNLPSIALIVARSVPGNVIGCDNKLPWRLKDDLRKFRELTSDHVVIMGRKTLESIGRPLPNRINIVLSRSKIDDRSDVYWAGSKEEALFLADYFSILKGKDQFFVIGGGEIYRSFVDLFYRIYLTEVAAPDIDGDAFFQDQFDRRKWKLKAQESYAKSDVNDYSFEFLVYEKKRRYRRSVDIRQYMSDKEKFIHFVLNNPSKSGRGDDKTLAEHYGDLFLSYLSG